MFACTKLIMLLSKCYSEVAKVYVIARLLLTGPSERSPVPSSLSDLLFRYMARITPSM